jgi:hypothetical protein
LSVFSSTEATAHPNVDLVLARRLERAEGMANAAYVDARREVDPQVGAAWIEVAGVLAMFDGAISPITQTFGLGLFESFTAFQLDQIEEFFSRRGSPTSHEVSAFAPASILNLISARGYSPIEASTVLVRPTATTSPPGSGRITVRVVTDSETKLWARVAGEGWSSESQELAAFVEGFGLIIGRTRGAHCFLAELDGDPIAAAALNVSNGVALLAGASTIPDARRQGAQLALLQARLAFAADRQIELAMVVTQPGSASQRNAERQGFRPVYTRSKWQLNRGGA